MENRLFSSSTVNNRNAHPDASGVKTTGGKIGSLAGRFILPILLSLLVAACATTTEILPEKKPATVLPESGSFLDYSAEDRKLFEEGLIRLKATPEKPADHAGARTIFETLIQKHPASKWRAQAEIWLDHLDALSRMEEALKTCQKTAEEGQITQSRLQRETEQLRREIRQLNEKNQEELNRINQENEQLKRDLRLLKNMELQREKRERMLR